MSKHRTTIHEPVVPDLDEHEPKSVHKRNKVINHDNNVDLILAGRAQKVSIEIPDEPKERNQRMQKILIESENQYTHLLGEVTGDKYAIRGRPELELMCIEHTTMLAGSRPRVVRKHGITEDKEKGDEDETVDNTTEDLSRGEPSGSLGIKLLYYSTKSAFIFSPKVEDRMLAFLKDYPRHDLVIQASEVQFGDYDFATMDRTKPRLWRRFVREWLVPQLHDEDRMNLMDDRLNFEIPYTDDVEVESDGASSEDEEEKTKKKRKGKKKGAKKAAVSAGAGVSTKAAPPVPSTSARVQERLSVKKGVGLLAKRASVR